MKLFDVYPINNITITRAKGSYLWDDAGQQYLDMYGGHAVISIGHSHPHFISRITAPAESGSFLFQLDPHTAAAGAGRQTRQGFRKRRLPAFPMQFRCGSQRKCTEACFFSHRQKKNNCIQQIISRKNLSGSCSNRQSCNTCSGQSNRQCGLSSF